MASSLDQLIRNCVRAFGVLDIQLENPSIANTPKSDAVVRFKNLQSRFTRWSRNAGALQAGADTLDQKLQNNTRVKLQAIRLLSHSDGKQPSEIEDLVQLGTVNKTEFPERTICPLCKKGLRNMETYRDHIGKHQKQLALFAIPFGFTCSNCTYA
ncbi:uncharacterized protein BKA55DRAFT_148157 [Fusarium redolens]|jgi:hypothetical protein|uniref:C2H2-type domain-containing protein n=1 Tax=Fusarium redolens TaxID=48865 RepID=A0A9P9KQI1_FUSRE|nr:uncharacterized protein BKA55DRAFT_148157 [Fusarium redolens]KAH7266666.1 hypothetical protein BKA55DRAFT_148157 [Fusarium redolens]